MKTYYKSFVTVDHQPVLMTYEPEIKARSISQTLEEVLETGTLKPNTRHAQTAKRLCVSHITEEYPGTYRPEGLVFETEAKPNYVLPFDLMALTTGETFTSADYYHGFLPGFSKFKSQSVEEMLQRFPTSAEAIQELNLYRRRFDLEKVNEKKMNYNECCFESDILLSAKALIGEGVGYLELAERHGLPLYSSVEEYQNVRQNSETINSSGADISRKAGMGALFRVGSTFTLDSIGYMILSGGDTESFLQRFQMDKFLTVTAMVMAINCVDYKWNITDRMDRWVKKEIEKLK